MADAKHTDSGLRTQDSGLRPARRMAGIELSLIRQINALATPLSVNLGIGEPNLEPDDTFREMARRAATTSWRYSPNAGALSLRKRLGEAFGVDKADVCVTAGTEEGLYAIFQAYVGEGDEVLVPDPGFLSYATLAKLCGATVKTYELEPPSWKFDALKITKKTKLIVVNSPSNPLGAIVDEDSLDAIAQTGVLVVADEVYREIWYESPPPSMLGRGSNVLVVGGMSKSHGMTGLRLGWILGAAELLAPVVTAHQYIATCASVFSQALAGAASAPSSARSATPRSMPSPASSTSSSSRPPAPSTPSRPCRSAARPTSPGRLPPTPRSSSSPASPSENAATGSCASLMQRASSRSAAASSAWADICAGLDAKIAMVAKAAQHA